MTGTNRERALGPTVAGTWYPAGRERLAEQVDSLLDRPGSGADGSAPDGSRLRALIAPHAGYAYSGAVAAAGFRLLLDESFARVVLLGPSHYAAFEGGALPSAAYYRTPLGEVRLDAQGIARLGALPGMRIDDAPFLREHSLEAEIPFLQRTLRGDWRLLPLLIGGGCAGEELRRVAEAVRPLIGPSTLAVVSSDLTHFGPRFEYVPFTEEIPGRIRDLDMGAVRHILARDADAFAEYVRRTGATICGRNAIEALLRMLPGGTSSALVAYDTSGAITGDWSHSVSYASLTFRSGGEPA